MRGEQPGTELTPDDLVELDDLEVRAFEENLRRSRAMADSQRFWWS